MEVIERLTQHTTNGDKDAMWVFVLATIDTVRNSRVEDVASVVGVTTLSCYVISCPPIVSP